MVPVTWHMAPRHQDALSVCLVYLGKHAAHRARRRTPMSSSCHRWSACSPWREFDELGDRSFELQRRLLEELRTLQIRLKPVVEEGLLPWASGSSGSGAVSRNVRESRSRWLSFGCLGEVRTRAHDGTAASSGVARVPRAFDILGFCYRSTGEISTRAFAC